MAGGDDRTHAPATFATHRGAVVTTGGVAFFKNEWNGLRRLRHLEVLDL